MMRSLASLAGVCLLLAGCSTMAETASDETGGLLPFRSPIALKGAEAKLIEAVQKDPFPEAADVNLGSS